MPKLLRLVLASSTCRSVKADSHAPADRRGPVEASVGLDLTVEVRGDVVPELNNPSLVEVYVRGNELHGVGELMARRVQYEGDAVDQFGAALQEPAVHGDCVADKDLGVILQMLLKREEATSVDVAVALGHPEASVVRPQRLVVQNEVSRHVDVTVAVSPLLRDDLLVRVRQLRNLGHGRNHRLHA